MAQLAVSKQADFCPPLKMDIIELLAYASENLAITTHSILKLTIMEVRVVSQCGSHMPLPYALQCFGLLSLFRFRNQVTGKSRAMFRPPE